MMKQKLTITKTELKKLIKEEIEAVLNELNPYHDPATGKLSSGKAGDVYSLSRPATDAAGWDSEKAKKGLATKKGKVSYKFGMADGDKACGRKTVSGKKISPKRRCSKYPKKYEEDLSSLIPSVDDAESDRRDKLGYSKHLQALVRGVIRLDELPEDDVYINAQDLVSLIASLVSNEQEILESNSSALQAKCNQAGYMTINQASQSILRSLNAYKLAMDGRLLDPKKK